MSRNTLILVLAAFLVSLTILYLQHSTDLNISLIPNVRLSPVRLERPTELSQADNRQLAENECLSRYPALYHEADRAEQWYARRGGITEDMVDKAELDGGHARLVILNNKVGTSSYGKLIGSFS